MRTARPADDRTTESVKLLRALTRSDERTSGKNPEKMEARRKKRLMGKPNQEKEKVKARTILERRNRDVRNESMSRLPSFVTTKII